MNCGKGFSRTGLGSVATRRAQTLYLAWIDLDFFAGQWWEEGRKLLGRGFGQSRRGGMDQAAVSEGSGEEYELYSCARFLRRWRKLLSRALDTAWYRDVGTLRWTACRYFPASVSPGN
jgi:hypothetical protein